MKRYNLGSGGKKILGWVNVDVDHEPDVTHDLSQFPWPFPDREAVEIQASHILEHFTKRDAYKFLNECHRIMRTGGELHIAVPDMDKFIDAHLSGDFEPLGEYFWTDLNHLMGGDEREAILHQRHKYMYNYETLHFMLLRVGFYPKLRLDPLEIDSPEYVPISLYVDGRKIS